MTLRNRRGRSLALAALTFFTASLVLVGPEAQAQVAIKVKADEVAGPVLGTAVFPLPFAAQHVAVHWEGNPEAQVTIATSTDGVTFGEAVDVGRDEVGEQARNGETYGAVLPAGGAIAARISSDKPLGRATVLAMADGERIVSQLPVPRLAGAAVDQPGIVSRAGWGADESLRFRGKREIWPPEFSPVQKTIVHHTAGANNDTNPESTIRAIYRYHAVTQGWGDIGYNFLISADGRIFKGRHSHPPTSQLDTITGENAAGETVTAAHAYQHNAGTVGVALLGNFLGTDRPTSAARNALVQFLAWKLDRHGLDPEGTSVYRNPVNGVSKELPNIAGHLDANPDTECPGGNLYDDLPNIRKDVKAVLQAAAGSTPTTTTTSTLASSLTGGASRLLPRLGR